MELYWIIWGIVISISFLDLCKIDYRYKKFFMICILLICILIGGFRAIGTDWEQYYTYFMDRNTLDEFSDTHYGLYYEVGFVYINYIIKCITNEYFGMLLFLTAVVCFFKYKMITQISKGNLILVIFALNFSYYLGDFFPVRQSIAAAILIYSIIFIAEKDLFKFTIMVIIASFFHRSAIIFFPAYWLYYSKISNKKAIIIIIISFFIGYSELLNKIISIFAGVDLAIIDKLIAYTDSGEVAIGAYVSGTLKVILSFSKKIVLFIIFALVREKIRKKINYYDGFFNLFLISFVLTLIFNFSAPEVASRASIYYNFVEIFLVANILIIFNKFKYKIFVWCIIILYCFIQYYYAIYKFYDIYVPYKSILG